MYLSRKESGLPQREGVRTNRTQRSAHGSTEDERERRGPTRGDGQRHENQDKAELKSD